MKFEEMVAVSGMSGVFKLIANRSNGLIIEDIDTGKKKLAPSRKHQFTPLASIGIYSGDDDTTELGLIFRTMRDQLEKNPPVPVSSNADALSTYFASIVPDYDRDRVFSGDIKKVIKWFNFLNQRNLVPEEEEEKVEEKETEVQKESSPAAEKKEEKPKAKKETKAPKKEKAK